MSTNSATFQSKSSSSDGGSKQGPRRIWLRVLLILLIVALVLLATVGLAWQFLVSPQLSCSLATNPTRSGAVSEYCLPGNGENYGAMTVGPDGNLWFTDSDKIGRITTHGVITEFAVPYPPTAIPKPGIARGSDGNLWYISGTKLGRISPQGRFVGVVAMPAHVWYITGLTAARDGTIWVGLSNAGETNQLTYEIARVTASGEVTTYALPGPVAPTGGLVAGADGNLWAIATDTSIAPITPTGHLMEYAVAIHNPPLVEITPGPDGNIWFIDSGGGVGKITSAGDFTLFPTDKQTNVGMTSIGSGPDGNIWFSTGSNFITRITPSGATTQFTLPHTGNATAITTGPDGGVWFMQVSSNVVPFLVSVTRIVRITP
jgi:streptogramin lyase